MLDKIRERWQHRHGVNFTEHDIKFKQFSADDVRYIVNAVEDIERLLDVAKNGYANGYEDGKESSDWCY